MKVETVDENLKKTLDVFRNNDSFLLAGHEHPDGDCIGSEIALALLLKKWDKDVHIFNPDPPEPIYYFLPYIQWVKTTLPEEPVDVAVILDSGDLNRTGAVQEYIKSVETMINVDHHPESFNVGDINLVDPEMSSVGEIVYNMYHETGETISKEAAQVLYISLMTDTGSFRYANTQASSHEAAAELIRNGYIEPYRIYSMLYERETFESTQLFGEVLSNIQEENGIVWAEVPRTLFEGRDVEPQDLKGVLQYMRRIDICKVAVLFQERSEDEVKVNFRAKSDFNLLSVVNQFDGGGHEKAAGATIQGSLDTIREEFLSAVKEALPASTAAR
ncbi:MAG: bifunctional oligoribonuclease/PAP phosphatase NrnA [bacterium]